MTSRRVLVVDDEDMIGLMLQDWLTELGYSVAGPAKTAQEALDLIAQSTLHAAILDVSLGNGTSYGVADALKKLSVPVVFATGYGADGIEPRFAACPTLAKPFDFDSVARVMSSLGG